ncbi:MAG: DNA primase [Candidatus Neomarinimicrobiota bacterium]|nr:DNA primase [Candidatus Neomarinimicrobiota bacterium]
MSRISQEVIEQVRQTADILDIISGVVNLKKRGQNYFGLCPFHNEKTPSFSVAPAKEIYHCFGCNAGGNVFHFLMEYEKMTFVEAVKNLGDRYGIEVKLGDDDRNQEELKRLRDFQSSALRFYEKLLSSAEGKSVTKYLQGRGLSKDIIKDFQLGFAPDSWDRLLKLARKNGIPGKIMDKSGLFTRTEKGVFDRFRNRLMFPIHNPGGQVIAFGGRAMDEKDPAKYMNSPETVLYSKSRVFYGLNKTQKAIRKAGTSILVEGYMDFLQLYQAGITNVLAVSGTAFTENHVHQVRKLTRKIILMYDGDNAGREASVRTGYLLLRGGIEPLIVSVPGGLDPDDWVRQDGAEAINEKIKTAQPLITYHIQRSSVNKMSAVERSGFIGGMVTEVVGIQDNIFRNEIFRSISDEMQINERDLLAVADKEHRRRRMRRTKSDVKSNVPLFSSQGEKAQLELVKLLAGEDLTIRQKIRDTVILDYFTSPVLKKLAEFFFSQYEVVDYGAVLQNFETKDEQETVAGILLDLSVPEEVDRTIDDCINSLKAGPFRKKIESARMKLLEIEKSEEDVSDLLLEISELRVELNSLTSENR